MRLLPALRTQQHWRQSAVADTAFDLAILAHMATADMERTVLRRRWSVIHPDRDFVMDAQSRKPPSWVPGLLRQFGTNPFGKPNWRVIWSEDRIRYECGAQRRTYGEGRNSWMVERWMPPETYGDRGAWMAMVEPDGSSSLGPFPTQGDYEWAFTFEIPDSGEGIPLDPGILSLLCQCIERGKLATDAQRKTAIKARMERQEREWHERFNQVFDEAQGPFGGQQVSGIPSKRTPDDIVIRPRPDVVRKLGTTGPSQISISE